MKIISVLFLFLFFAFLGFSQTITGSDHDFSTKGWANNPGNEICVVCHTPHNAQPSSSAPLWNHDNTVASFTPYISGTLNASVGQPDGVSKVCLSCHDGTVALDSFGGTTGSEMMTGSENLGTDLSDEHPISFIYDATLAAADGSLHDPTLVASGLGGTISQDLLFAGKLQCSSCHNPHDDSNGSFLLKSNNGSSLCLTCHNK